MRTTYSNMKFSDIQKFPVPDTTPVSKKIKNAIDRYNIPANRATTPAGTHRLHNGFSSSG